ncbi:DUF6197 family protein [Streptomyces griseoluteus]
MTATRTRDRIKPAPATTLDERLALASLAMDARLDQAALAVAVNSAHIPVDPLPEVTVPHLPQTATPNPYRTPIAALLHRARVRIETDGWCRDALFDESGAVCPIRAIRLEAASRDQADNACFLLLESIRRHWQAATIPSWNAAQGSAAPVLLAFDQAGELAHARGL